VFGRASNLADRAKDITDRGARDEALKKAANEIMPLFTRCARCNKWADETCFNTARGLCVSCAPNLAAEMEAERASVELSQMRQTMAGETVFSGDTSARATVCKTCGKPVGSEKLAALRRAIPAPRDGIAPQPIPPGARAHWRADTRATTSRPSSPR